MSISVPSGASDLFEKGNHHAVDDGLVLVYGLKGVTEDSVMETCERATESYAREVLDWPNRSDEKPQIFKVVGKVDMEDLNACAKYFAEALGTMFDSNPPKGLPTYPHAFVVVSETEPEEVIVVLAHKSANEWALDYCNIPVAVGLGMTMTSLTFGDITEEDILDDYGWNGQSKEASQ